MQNAESAKTQEQIAKEEEDKWRSSVGQYANAAQYVFETDEKVYIVHPSLRAPLGEFRIKDALSNNFFKLEWVHDGSAYPDPVEGKYLRRDPFAPGA